MSTPSRTVCAMLEEMRACCKNYDFAALKSLIDEATEATIRMINGIKRNKL